MTDNQKDNFTDEDRLGRPIERRRPIHQTDIPPKTIYPRHLKLDKIRLSSRRTDPDDPAKGFAIIWMSNGDSTGTDGDLLIKITNDVGTTVTKTLMPYSPSAYTVTNGTTDRTYDADSTSTAELADILATLLADLKTLGIVG